MGNAQPGEWGSEAKRSSMSHALEPNAHRFQVLAVHAAFLNYEQIIFFGGNQRDLAVADQHQIDATCLSACDSLIEEGPIDRNHKVAVLVNGLRFLHTHADTTASNPVTSKIVS